MYCVCVCVCVRSKIPDLNVCFAASTTIKLNNFPKQINCYSWIPLALFAHIL